MRVRRQGTALVSVSLLVSVTPYRCCISLVCPFISLSHRHHCGVYYYYMFFTITHAEHFIHGRPFPSSEAATLPHEAAAADNTNLGRLKAGAELLCLEMATVTPDSPTDTIRSMFKDVEKRQGMGADFHNKHKYTCREKVAYMIDRGFESPRIQALLIAFILILGICIGAVLIFIGDKYVTPDDPSVPGYGAAATFAEAIWKSWTYMADPGTHADVDSNVYFRTSAFITAIMGILLMAAIIGFRRRRHQEENGCFGHGAQSSRHPGHILIMGWTEKTIQVIDQIALMMESEGGGTIVLCSDKAKRDA